MNDGIKLVLFDFDDTLVSTIVPKWEQHKHVARLHYGKELTDAEILQHWGKPLREYLCLVYGTDDIEHAITTNAHYEADFPKSVLGPIGDIVATLKEDGKFVGIVTANGIQNLEQDLAITQISTDIFDYIQTEEDTIFHKPDGRVFKPVHKYIAELNIYPDEVLYVGDGMQDFKAATEAGFQFIGVESGLLKAHDFRAAGATSIADVTRLMRVPATPYKVAR